MRIGNNHILIHFKLVLLVGIVVASCLSTSTGLAQVNIVRAEYFVNDDPGFGLATAIGITPGANIDFSFPAETSALPSGYHNLYIRAQDENGVWSYLESRQFYVIKPGGISTIPTPKLTEIEYFINDDPGQGLATNIDITDDFTADITDIAAAASLLPGYHTIGTRARTEYGSWGWTEYRNFYVTTTGSITVPTVKQIVGAEYYFDIDPGQGQATPIGSFGPSFTVDMNELAPSSLTPGYHTFNIRAQDEDGHWGFLEQRPIYVITAGSTTSITDINKVEYFFDGDDPGVGNATSLAIAPGQQEIELSTVDIPTSTGLVDGEHTITFRARNGNGWGLAEIDTFDVLDDCTQPITSFDAQLACAGSAVTFLNTSDSLQVDATYRWYLDGDAIIDETTQNASFTYPFPGTYVVALAIRQGTICLDSIATTIEIQPQPVAVFSTSGGVLNQLTNFIASASNLPAGAIWAWDFDGDFIIDSNVAGNTSFIYSSEGTFSPSLTITDSLGCFITTTNPVVVSSSGGGSSPPFVDFLANNDCAGNVISFIDISQNLPAGSTYSWDFDGDGTEDSADFGSTSFTYSTAGSFDATLTIDLGGPTISATHTMSIVDVPIADFSAADVCEGTAMAFTDLSTAGTGDNVYMWDFNNDGVVDSNASSDITFTYPSAGSHIVSLTIANGNGCEHKVVKQVNVIAKPIPNFDWNLVCTGQVILFNDLSLQTIDGATYSWDLNGDGTEDSDLAGDIEYTFNTIGVYNAALTIDNLNGCSTTVTKSIEVFDVPEVVFDIDAQCYGQESLMIDLSQKVSGSATYAWDFQSDGNIDDTTVGSTSFIYPSYNSYIVSLTIDNGGNCLATTEALVEFADAATPDFETNKLCEGEEVVFTNLSTDVNPAAIYSWDFNGDGAEDSAFPGSTSNTYATAGTYDATLTIDNGGNCLAFKTIPLVITEPPPVDLGADLELCVAGTVTFDAGIGYTAYLWPDGSTEQSYTVDQVGEYTIRVQDALQCFNTDTVEVRLLGPPEPAFEYTFDLSFQGIRVLFNNQSANADTYTWDFGEGSISNEENPSFIFGEYSFYQTSIYDVCLTAINNCNEVMICEQIFVSPTEFLEEADAEISVYPNPVVRDLSIKLEPNKTYKRVAIANAYGKILWEMENPGLNYDIDVSQYTQGVYFVLLEAENKILFKKVMKK